MSTCIYKSKIKINKVKINNKNKINFSYPWCLCYCCFLEPGPWKRFGFSAMWWYLYFLAHCDKVPPQKQLKEGMVCCVSRSDAAVLGGEGEGTEMGGGWSHCVQSQETERKEFWCSAGSPVFFSVCFIPSAHSVPIRVVFLPQETFVWMHSQTHPEAWLLGGSQTQSSWQWQLSNTRLLELLSTKDGACPSAVTQIMCL